MSTPIPDLICQYLQHLRLKRNVSPHTLESYGRDLKHLQMSLLALGVHETQDVSPEHLGKHLAALDERGGAAASRRRALSSLRQLFLFALEQRIILHNPARDLLGPQVPRILPKVPSPQQAAAMLDALTDETPMGLRDRAAMELLYGAGLRASELCELRVEDVDLEQPCVRPGHSSKARLVPMGPSAVAALARYTLEGRPKLVRDTPTSALFLGARGKPLTRMALFKAVKRAAQTSGLASFISPHTLRHACAAHMVDGGADLRAVAEMLGHRSVATTEIYTRIGDAALQKVVDAHHPMRRRRRPSNATRPSEANP